MPAPFPLVNGVECDFSSIKIRLAGSPLILVGFKQVSYKHSLKPGKKRGAFAQVTGMSRGQYDGEGSLTLYKPQAVDFVTQLAQQAAANGLGYMEYEWPATVNYSEAWMLGAPYTDQILSARITDEEDSHEEGTEVLVTKFTLAIRGIIKNGNMPLSKTVAPFPFQP